MAIEASLASLDLEDMVEFANRYFRLHGTPFTFAVDPDGKMEAFANRLG